jgi:hypothetical protein
MRRIAFAIAIAALSVNACSGPAESPTSPSLATAPGVQVRSAAGPVDARPLDAPDASAVNAVEPAAAINLSGVWRGTVKDGSEIIPVDFKLTHTGKTIVGPLTKPKIPGFNATLTLTEKSISGVKRTYTASLKIIVKTDKCPTSTRPGTMVIDTTKKTLTGSVAGKNTDCIKRTVTFNLKKV